MWSHPVGLHMSGTQGGVDLTAEDKAQVKGCCSKKVRIREKRKPKDEPLAMAKLWGQYIKGFRKEVLENL